MVLPPSILMCDKSEVIAGKNERGGVGDARAVLERVGGINMNL